MKEKLEKILNKNETIDFDDGWNCYGLTIRGKKNKIEELLLKKKLNEFDIKTKVINNDITEAKVNGYISLEVALEILKNYPSFKYTTFWEGNPDFALSPEMYILYSESGSNEITDYQFVAELSSEDEYNPLHEIDITNKNKEKYTYDVSDSHSGYEDEEEVEYAFPFYKQFENNNYIDCQDNSLDSKKINKIEKLSKEFIEDKEVRKKYCDNKEVMLDLIKVNSYCIRYASKNLYDDEDFIIKAVSNGATDLYKLSERLRDNKELFLELLKVKKNHLEIIGYISERLKDDSDFLLEIAKYENVGRGISKRLSNNKEFMIKLSKYESASIYASKKLQDDEDYLLSLLNEKEVPYLSASDRLKNDKNFMLKMLEKSPLAIYHISNELKKDTNFILEAIDILVQKHNTINIYNIPDCMDNEEVLLKLIKYNKNALSFASNRLKNDKNFILKAMEIYDGSLQYASDEIKKEIENN